MSPPQRLLVPITLALLLVTACGSEEGSADGSETDPSDSATSTAVVTSTAVETTEAAVAASTAVATSEVAVAGFAFDPPSIAIEPGDTVTWTNGDEALHTITPVESSVTFGGGLDGVGAVVEATFDEPGTFEYFCSIHTSMTGVVIVGG
jgi:plastocyanin